MQDYYCLTCKSPVSCIFLFYKLVNVQLIFLRVKIPGYPIMDIGYLLNDLETEVIVQILRIPFSFMIVYLDN